MMNTGIEIQNCASNTLRRFGNRCNHTSLMPEKPDARAIQINSDLIKSLAPAQITRADAAHPSKPSSVNVTVTEACGEIFNGSVARTVISRKSQGTDRNRSIRSLKQRSIQPP